MMTEHTDKGLNLGNFVFDDNNQERQSWKCFGQTCNRSLVVFLSQIFVILVILASCIVRITLATTCEETLQSFLVHLVIFYLHLNYEQDNFLKRSNFCFIGWSKRVWRIFSYTSMIYNWTFSTGV